MRKFKSSLILAIISFNSFGQTSLNVEVSNPEPRINEYIELKFDLGMIDSIFNLKLDSMTLNPNPFYETFIEKSLSFSNLGLHKLGPFYLELNGVKYISDTISINVINSLPQEEGIWLRFVKNNKNDHLIILEQIIRKKYNIEKSREYGVRNTKKQLDKNAFNTLVRRPIRGINLSIIGYMYYQYSPYEGEKNKKVFFYSRQVYMLDGDFKGLIEITNDFFTRSPKNLKTKYIRIE